jgi:hypothetical protein
MLKTAIWTKKMMWKDGLPNLTERKDVVEKEAGRTAGLEMIGREMIGLAAVEDRRDAGPTAKIRIGKGKFRHSETLMIGWTKICL